MGEILTLLRYSILWKRKKSGLSICLCLEFFAALLGCTSVNRKVVTRFWMFSTPSGLFKSYQVKVHLNSATPAFVFSPSLDICATDQRTKRNTPLTVCKIHALECMGRKYSLTNAENCKVPQAAEIPCGSCRSWEKCNGKRFFTTVSKIVHMIKRKSLSPLTD